MFTADKANVLLALVPYFDISQIKTSGCGIPFLVLTAGVIGETKLFPHEGGENGVGITLVWVTSDDLGAESMFLCCSCCINLLRRRDETL